MFVYSSVCFDHATFHVRRGKFVAFFFSFSIFEQCHETTNVVSSCSETHIERMSIYNGFNTAQKSGKKSNFAISRLTKNLIFQFLPLCDGCTSFSLMLEQKFANGIPKVFDEIEKQKNSTHLISCLPNMSNSIYLKCQDSQKISRFIKKNYISVFFLREKKNPIADCINLNWCKRHSVEPIRKYNRQSERKWRRYPAVIIFISTF